MADFIFRVQSVNLTNAQKQKIAAAIQGAVLSELAQLDLGAVQSAPDLLFRPITWAGGMMIPPGDLPNVVGTTFTVAATAA